MRIGTNVIKYRGRMARPVMDRDCDILVARSARAFRLLFINNAARKQHNDEDRKGVSDNMPTCFHPRVPTLIEAEAG